MGFGTQQLHYSGNLKCWILITSPSFQSTHVSYCFPLRVKLTAGASDNIFQEGVLRGHQSSLAPVHCGGFRTETRCCSVVSLLLSNSHDGLSQKGAWMQPTKYPRSSRMARSISGFQNKNNLRTLHLRLFGFLVTKYRCKRNKYVRSTWFMTIYFV